MHLKNLKKNENFSPKNTSMLLKFLNLFFHLKRTFCNLYRQIWRFKSMVITYFPLKEDFFRFNKQLKTDRTNN